MHNVSNLCSGKRKYKTRAQEPDMDIGVVLIQSRFRTVDAFQKYLVSKDEMGNMNIMSNNQKIVGM